METVAVNRVIRKATVADVAEILLVMEAAKGIMRAAGNLHQWVGGYPSETVILKDIECKGGYVVEDDRKTVGYFAFLPSPEPTYNRIEEGEWMDDSRPFHVVHRIASYPDVHHVLKDILDFCFSVDENIRIDTHRDNLIMQHNLVKNGFKYCGIIYLESGDERLAYQRVRDH